MFEEVNIQRHLSELGLKQTEIDSLELKDAIQYIRFFHRKEWGISTILFIGFSDEEIGVLSDRAENCKLSVKNRLANNLSFICVSENAAQKRVEKARSYNAIILKKDEFEIIFDGSEYNLTDSELLYEQSVPKEFRITKPLSNFDQDIDVESFSFDSDIVYLVNLYQMTCTCKDFEKKQRHQYLKGDIRRLCKHLIDVYKNSFGSIGMSDLNKYIIENGYPVNKHFSYFNIEKIPLPIVVNYESKDDWWNIFMSNENGIYSRYGYYPNEKRFANNDKPRGFVPTLRNKLDELVSQLDNNNRNTLIESSYQKNVISKGCLYLTIIIVLIFVFILYKIF
jgi:hypothetical protein